MHNLRKQGLDLRPRGRLHKRSPVNHAGAVLAVLPEDLLELCNAVGLFGGRRDGGA